jgi:DNA-binding HxlR family transcriptional regulator
MGSSEKTEYCAFTKAVEHLGDRWSLLIVRELALFGPQGFNTLATGLPGHVSRSVLTDKLRKLEEMGVVARDPSVASRSAPYCLTPAGEQLMPTLKSLWAWAEQKSFDSPDDVRRFPKGIVKRHRVRPHAVESSRRAGCAGGRAASVEFERRPPSTLPGYRGRRQNP